MSILSLVRDYGTNPAIVRMTTNDTLSTMTTPGYLTSQMSDFNSINGGYFEWSPSDMILCYYPGGWQFFLLSANNTSLINYSGELPSPVVAESVLISDKLGSPVWRGPLTNGQLIIGSTGNAPVAATLTGGTGVTITNGAGSIVIDSTGGSGIATINGDVGSITGGTVSLVGGGTGLTFNGSVATMTLDGILVGHNGGTGVSNNGLTINLGSASLGYVLTSDVSGNAAWASLPAPSISVTDLVGTANQVLVNGGSGVPTSGSITLTLPQSIATTSDVTFNSIKVGVALPGQYGGTGTINNGQTIDLSSPTAGFVLTSDPLGNATWQAAASAGVSSATGTANEVLVNGTSGVPQTGAITYSLPQAIGTSSAVTFGSLTLATPLSGANGGTGVVNSGLTITLTGGALGDVLTRDLSGNALWATPPAGGVPSITGTSNQVLVNGGSGVPVSTAVTLTLPQDIATTSSVTFNDLTLAVPLTGDNGGTGVANTGLTINLGTPTAGFVLTSDVLGNASWASIPGVHTSTTLVNSTPYTVLTSDENILVDTNGIAGPSSIVLPTAPLVDGQVWTIKDWSGSAEADPITVSAGGTTIDGNTSLVLAINYESASFVYSVSQGTYSVVYGYDQGVVITGDSGTASGSAITIDTGSATRLCGSSITFVGDNIHTLSLSVSDAQHNTFLGKNSGSATATGQQNNSFGSGNMSLLTTGHDNHGLGHLLFNSLLTGNNNLGMGTNAGNTYVGAESSNIVFNSIGVIGDSNTLRIGTGTGSAPQQLNRAFISGISGINVGSVATIVTEAGNQLGTAVLTAGSNITITPAANIIAVSVSVTDLNSNTFLGLGTGNNTLTGTNNTGFGAGNLPLLTTGSNNSAFGSLIFPSLDSGSNNVGIGENVGANLTSSESSNILINSAGSNGESNAMRLGNGTGTGAGQLSSVYISGIYGVAPDSPASPQVITVDNNDQFAVIDSSVGGYVLTSNGGDAPTFKPIPVSGWTLNAVSFTAVIGQNYFVTAASVTATLPVGTSTGSTINFIMATTSPVIIQANAGQRIQLGTVVTGVGGTATSANKGDAISLVYDAGSNIWYSLSSVGNDWNLL